MLNIHQVTQSVAASEWESYSAGFRAALMQCGAWSAEARRVLALASALNVALDEEQLKMSDVHDLQALRFELAQRMHPERRAS